VLYKVKDGIPQCRCSGVYDILNTVNGKLYVGSTVFTIRNRLIDHRHRLRRGVHPNRHLQAAWNKYGEAWFRFRVREVCTPQECLDRETYWIGSLRATDTRCGYNVCREGCNRQGVRHSAAARMKMSEAKRGKPNGRKGIPHTEETKARIAAVKRGKPLNIETRMKMSAAQKGRPKSAEHKAKTRTTHWSRSSQAEEVKAKISAGLRRNALT